MDCADSARVERISKNLRELISEIKQINPAIIVLIKATVHKALFQQLDALEQGIHPRVIVGVILVVFGDV